MKRVGVLCAALLLVLMGFGWLSGENVQAQAPTLPPTNTPRGTLPSTATATIQPTETTAPSATATETMAPTETAIPTDTNTAAPTAPLLPTETEVPALTSTPEELNIEVPPTPTVYYPLNPEGYTAATAIPTAMPRLLPRDRDGNQYNVINIALIGHDSESIEQNAGVFRTDTMIIVNINLTTNTVSMLSLPRDLVVWVPEWDMQRLNLAWGRGEAVGWTDGGWGLFRQTVLYNFGIELHYYAMIDFTGFKTLIDTLGGVDIAVDCPIQDYLWTGDYDANNEPVFELTTLPVGFHHLDSREALWYSRSRRNSSDFDRGRRQQQVLRAIWAEGRDLGLITDLPNLWDDLNTITTTNVPLTVMVQLIPLALQIQPNQIENHFFRLGIETQPWTPPSGENLQVPSPTGAMISLIQNFLTPPTENQVVTDQAHIEIYDASGSDGQWDWVAADRLAWEGILAQPMGSTDEVIANTFIIDYTGSSKGSSLETLVNILNVNPEDVQIQPDPNRTTDFQIVLGSNYNSCVDRQVREVEDIVPVTATPRP